MISGTIKNTVKMQVMQNEWQQKKNDLNAKKQTKELTPEERMIAHFQEQVDKERESNSHADLYTKLETGGKLTADEIAYLEKNDPEALQKYREDQAEKEAYERELKNCRTKEDVERVKMNKLGNFAAQAKKISTDPYIPVEKKVKLMKQLNNKLSLVNEAHKEFLDTKQYKDMPTDSELQEERVDEAIDNMEEMQTEVKETHDEISTGNQAEAQNGSNVDVLEIKASEDARNDILTDDAEDKLKKASYEKETKKENDTEQGSYSEITFDKLSKEIKTFIMSTGEGYGKIDISL